MNVVFTPRALRDVLNIANYFEKNALPGAVNVRQAIHDTVALVSEYPGAGRRQHSHGVRKIATRDYPYLIYYRTNAGRIEIISIRHAARRRLFRDV